MESKKCKYFVLILLILLLIQYFLPKHSVQVLAAEPNVTADPSPDPLTESNLNGAVINLTVSGDQFINSLSFSDFRLNNNPSGTAIARINRIDDTNVELTIAYNGEDMSADVTNFNIRVHKEGFVSGSADIDSNTMTIQSEDGYTGHMFGIPNPEPLTEENLDGAIITFTNPLWDFKTPGFKEDFTLINAPTGLSVSSYTPIDKTICTITLSFDGTDFDTDFTNFYVRVEGGDTVAGGRPMLSNNIPITAAMEGPVTLTASTNPSELNESNLEGSIINLTLEQTSFSLSINESDIELNNAPVGLSVANVIRDSETQVRIILSFNETDFDTDMNDFSVTVLSSAVESAEDITSNTLVIKATMEIEGQGNYTVTGNSYPTQIQKSGFDVRSGTMYLNIELETNYTVGSSERATFYYFIEIFNGTGELIGNWGSIVSPKQVTGDLNSQISELKNIAISVPTNLPAENRTVVTIESVNIN